MQKLVETPETMERNKPIDREEMRGRSRPDDYGKTHGRSRPSFKLMKWFRKDNLIVFLLLGVLLVVIAWPVSDNGKSGENAPSSTITGTSYLDSYGKSSTISRGNSSAVSETYQNTDAYIHDMEQRLTLLLSRMKGVGKVQVMITLEATGELVIDKEQKTSVDSTVEQDSQGGNRNIYKQQSDQEAIYHTDGKKDPYVIMTYLPKVEGVVVLAQGAGTGDINSNITDAVIALFGIEAHKVKVLKMTAD